MIEKQYNFAKGLFITSVIYGLLAIIIGYFYSLPKSWFFGIIAVIALIIGCYHYCYGRYLDNNFALISIGVLFVSIAIGSNDIFHRQPLAMNKDKLIQITGIIPDKHFEVKKGKYTDHYFRLDNENLNCAETNDDICNRAYEYKGQIATAYYQNNTMNGKLLYELQVENHKIYDFDSQLQFYQNERKKINNDLCLLIILYGLPMIIFACIIHYQFKKYYHKNSPYQEIEHETEPKEFNWLLSLIGIIASLVAILGFILVLWGKSTQNHALALQGLAMIIIFGWVVYLAI